jgi:hypothetical protein
MLVMSMRNDDFGGERMMMMMKICGVSMTKYCLYCYCGGGD